MSKDDLFSKNNQFAKVLRAFKFKERDSKQHRQREFTKGEDPETCLYAEVYEMSTGNTYCWIVGNGIPKKTYPAGMNVYSGEDLRKALQNTKK